MADHDFGGAFSAVWKVGAGVALIVGLGELIHPRDSRVQATTAEHRYVRDSLSGSVAVPIHFAALHGTVWLTGCPRTPVVLLERELPSGAWGDQVSINHACTGSERGAPVRVMAGRTATTIIRITTPGRYRASVPWGNNWTWSSAFTVI